MALAQKFRTVRRYKNNKIGVMRKIHICIPFSKRAFRNNFVTKVPQLSTWNGKAQNCKIPIDQLDPVLGQRWNIGQSKMCSTQARVIGDVYLRYRRANVEVKQTSFFG